MVAVSQAQQTPPRVEQEKPIPQALRAMPCHQAIEFLLPDNSALLPRKWTTRVFPSGNVNLHAVRLVESSENAKCITDAP